MERILLPIDFSDVTEPAIRMAEVFAVALDAEVHLVHVAPGGAGGVPWESGLVPMQYDPSDERRRLDELVQRFRAQGVAAEASVLRGPVIQTILDQIEHRGIDLVILGSHGHGAVYQMLLGSVSEGVMHRAGCPVVTVPSPGKMAAHQSHGRAGTESVSQ